jgi:hypothetical protein
MPIRFATLSDVPALVEGAGRAHALTRGRSQPYDTQRAGQAFTELIEQRQSTYGCFVAEDAEGRIAGALIGAIERRILSNACTASVMHFEVLPDRRMGRHAIRLLGAFEAWSVNRGAVEIGFELRAAQMQRLGRFAARMGFRVVGGSYVKGPCG